MSRTQDKKSTGRTGAPSSVHRIERSELRAFDAEATGMILEAMDLGCVGRVSANGHAIVYNDAGDSASVARKMSAPNRTSRNARADMRRILSAQTVAKASAFGEIASPRSRVLSVAQAFADNGIGTAFSRWFDQQGEQLSPEDRVEVTTRPGSAPAFVLLPRIGQEGDNPDDGSMKKSTKTKSPKEKKDVATKSTKNSTSKVTSDGTGHACPVCEKSFPSGTSLGGHMSTHRATRSEPATPTPPTADPSQTLEAIRALLGEDPRLTELRATVRDLEEKLAVQTKRADEALTRLSLIEEAFHA